MLVVLLADTHVPDVLGRQRLRSWFPQADLVVFGHSHLPEDELGPSGQRRFNPGSPTQRRRAPWRSFGELQVDSGRIVSLEHRRVDPDG